MHDYTLHHGRKHVCRYCLQGFGTAETLTCYIKDFFKINGKQKIKMPNKGKYRLKNYERKIKSPFMIYVDSESMLLPEDNGKQNPNELIQTNIKSILLAVVAMK